MTTTALHVRAPAAVDRHANIGEFVLAHDRTAVLSAHGLGSCVALVLHDASRGIGAIAHFMLPSGDCPAAHPVKSVTGGLDAFLAAFSAAGGRLPLARAVACGGASTILAAGPLAIGQRNADALRTGLAARGVRLAEAHLGGGAGRTVLLDVGSGRVEVRTAGRRAGG